MELSLRATVAADVSGEGAVVVPGRLLLDIARALPDAEVSLEHLPEESVLVITSGSATYRIHTYSAEDFPHLPDLESSALQQVDADALLGTIARVGRSASRDESRPVLTGIFVSFDAGKLVMAATDSYRLAVKETASPGPLPDLEAIIPARALQELSRIAGGSDSVELALQENHVVFGAGDALLIIDVQNDFCPGGALAVPEGDTVIPVLNRWIDEANARGIPLGPIASFNRWKELGRHVKRGEKAIELCMPVTLKRKVDGGDSIDVAQSINALAEIAERRGDLAAALALSEQALAIYERIHGPGSVLSAMDYGNRCEYLNGLGRFAEALDSCQKALAIFKTSVEPDHAWLGYSYTSTGIALTGLHRPREARVALQRMLDIT